MAAMNIACTCAAVAATAAILRRCLKLQPCSCVSSRSRRDCGNLEAGVIRIVVPGDAAPQSPRLRQS